MTQGSNDVNTGYNMGRAGPTHRLEEAPATVTGQQDECATNHQGSMGESHATLVMESEG